MKSLKANDVWELVDLPAEKKAVGSKWVYKVKTRADGSIERHKTRLVAQGFTQIYGADYDETFCPVVRQESLCALIAHALSIQCGLKLHQVDVTTAFLNGILEEVYMKQPRGFVTEGEEHLVCRLRRLTCNVIIAGIMESWYERELSVLSLIIIVSHYFSTRL